MKTGKYLIPLCALCLFGAGAVVSSIVEAGRHREEIESKDTATAIIVGFNSEREELLETVKMMDAKVKELEAKVGKLSGEVKVANERCRLVEAGFSTMFHRTEKAETLAKSADANVEYLRKKLLEVEEKQAAAQKK